MSAPTSELGDCPWCCECSYCESVRERDRQALRNEGRAEGRLAGLREAEMKAQAAVSDAQSDPWIAGVRSPDATAMLIAVQIRALIKKAAA